MTLNTRSMVLIAAALVIAAFTAFMARSWLASERPVAEVAVQQQKIDNQIVVAKANLPAGRILQKGDLGWQAWPLENVPADYILKVSGSELDDLYGSVVNGGIHAGEPVGRPRVVRKGDHGFLAAVLTPGMRAVSLKVSPMTGVSGFVFPGDRVDLVLTHEVGGGGDQAKPNQASETVLENVRVLAIDQRADDQQNTPTLVKTVTVEVTPKQAERVALAQDMGDITLSLRSVGDPAVVADGGDMASAVPTEGKSYTWDHDISHVVSGRGGGGLGVVVVRGSTVAESEGGR